MDDYNVSNLHESKNEWSSRLVTLLTPRVIEGFDSIFKESVDLCNRNNEANKYLMTFQNFLSRIPKWNSTIIVNERKRIVEKSGCLYLEDLITCVHIIQLKILSCMRVCQKQKKIDIDIVKLDDFLHNIYIQCARKIYKNVYLFEKGIAPLLTQKHRRELEIIVQESILITIRESIPVEALLRAYMDETVEAIEEIKVEKNIEDIINDNAAKIVGGSTASSENVKLDAIDINNVKISDIVAPLAATVAVSPTIKNEAIRFNDIDSAIDTSNNVATINAPKNVERLEEISLANLAKSKQQEEEDSDEEDYKLKFSPEPVSASSLGIENLDSPNNGLDIEELL
jgi:hypothetical protein